MDSKDVAECFPGPIVSFSENIKKDKTCALPKRHVIVLLCFLCGVVITLQRLSLSMGLVAMVNQTAVYESPGKSTVECPAEVTFVLTNNSSGVHHSSGGHLPWDSEMQGHIVSASFFGFLLTQTPGGRIAEVVGARQILVMSIIAASVCNILSPLASEWSAYAFLGVHLVRGVAQGFQQPAMSCLMAQWFPSTEKGFLSSVVFSGFPGGAIIGGVICGALCDSEILGGWPTVFYAFGLCGLFLASGFYYLAPNSPEESAGITESELKYILSNMEMKDTSKNLSTPWKPLLTSSSTRAFFIGMFGQCWMTFYFVSVHPTYLGAVLHFTNTEIGYLNSIPYVGQMFLTYLSSFASTVLVKKGCASTDTVRKFCNSLSCVGFSAGLVAAAMVGCDKTMSTVFFAVAMSFVGLGFSGSCIVAVDMTVNFAGTLFGLCATFACISGLIIPLIVGFVTKQQTLAEWSIVFYISAVVCMGSAVFFHIFGSATIQDWDKPQFDEGFVNEAFDAELDLKPDGKVSDVRLESGLGSQYIIVEHL